MLNAVHCTLMIMLLQSFLVITLSSVERQSAAQGEKTLMPPFCKRSVPSPPRNLKIPHRGFASPLHPSLCHWLHRNYRSFCNENIDVLKLSCWTDQLIVVMGFYVVVLNSWLFNTNTFLAYWTFLLIVISKSINFFESKPLDKLNLWFLTNFW